MPIRSHIELNSFSDRHTLSQIRSLRFQKTCHRNVSWIVDETSGKFTAKGTGTPCVGRPMKKGKSATLNGKRDEKENRKHLMWDEGVYGTQNGRHRIYAAHIEAKPLMMSHLTSQRGGRSVLLDFLDIFLFSFFFWLAKDKLAYARIHITTLFTHSFTFAQTNE